LVGMIVAVCSVALSVAVTKILNWEELNRSVAATALSQQITVEVAAASRDNTVVIALGFINTGVSCLLCTVAAVNSWQHWRIFSLRSRSDDESLLRSKLFAVSKYVTEVLVCALHKPVYLTGTILIPSRDYTALYRFDSIFTLVSFLKFYWYVINISWFLLKHLG